MKPGDNIWNFTKEHLTGEGGGAGLGLAFVATVAERHRGEIQVEGVVGQGSTFMLRLPANNEESSVQSVSRLTHIDGAGGLPVGVRIGKRHFVSRDRHNAASSCHKNWLSVRPHREHPTRDEMSAIVLSVRTIKDSLTEKANAVEWSISSRIASN